MIGETCPRKRAIIIGGSLGGLFAGNMLQQAGWEVDIFKRSARDLDSRGGGIVLQPEVVEHNAAAASNATGTIWACAHRTESYIARTARWNTGSMRLRCKPRGH